MEGLLMCGRMASAADAKAMWLHHENRALWFQEFNIRCNHRERAAASLLLDKLSLMAGLRIAASSKSYIARGRCDMSGANVQCLAPWNTDVWAESANTHRHVGAVATGDCAHMSAELFDGARPGKS